MQEASASTLTAQVNDKALVEQFIKGNEKAFETLFKRYYQMLRKVAQYMLDDLEQAEELVQDAFVNIWEKRSNVNPDASFKNYLITAVRNRCLNHIKAKKENPLYRR
ncbi:sigma-70 family RNA polymerase sigma factor [Oscillatoria amoena NRMC-F 0135]|nr:sigma-70 family RNA polymerase sigma factor [Oscillatoria amoena NRMC-F 0135]